MSLYVCEWNMCTICTFQFFRICNHFCLQSWFRQNAKNLQKNENLEYRSNHLNNTSSRNRPPLFCIYRKPDGGEGSPTARNNTDDGTAIALHWLCFVHRSQNQGTKRYSCCHIQLTKQYWHGKIAVNTLFSNIGKTLVWDTVLCVALCTRPFLQITLPFE